MCKLLSWPLQMFFVLRSKDRDVLSLDSLRSWVTSVNCAFFPALDRRLNHMTHRGALVILTCVSVLLRAPDVFSSLTSEIPTKELHCYCTFLGVISLGTTAKLFFYILKENVMLLWVSFNGIHHSNIVCQICNYKNICFLPSMFCRVCCMWSICYL